MADIIGAIKAKIDVVEEIGLVVKLQKSGRSFKGHCPFHNERTPSFHVFAESQNWHCFGCGEGGDVFTFVQKQQGLEFRDALLYLAEKAGIAVEDYSSRNPEEEREANTAKERLRKLNEEALLWFHHMLLRSKEAAEARAYLQSRGISTDSVIAFSLGYAPDHWDGLCRYLLGRGYTEHELVNGGLARERLPGGGKSGGVYDYFRNRILFPIRDMRSRTIGFGGRALGDGQPKYLNSPQTLLFEKNSVLYALDMAKEAIKLAKQVVIVEGYVDAIIAHQYGTKQTVACIGSAITEKHIQQIKKLTKQVTLALDPDTAGATATEHGIQEALKTFDRTIVPVPLSANPSGRKYHEPRGMIRLEEQVDAEINILQLPAGEDPDEFIRRDISAWNYAVSHPLPLVDYYFKVRTADLDLRQPAAKAEAAKRLLPIIGMISDRIKRDAYIRELARMISIDERTLYAELQKVPREQRPTGVTAQSVQKASPPAGARGVPTLPPQANEVSGSEEPEWASEPGVQGASPPAGARASEAFAKEGEPGVQGALPPTGARGVPASPPFSQSESLVPQKNFDQGVQGATSPAGWRAPEALAKESDQGVQGASPPTGAQAPEALAKEGGQGVQGALPPAGARGVPALPLSQRGPQARSKNSQGISEIGGLDRSGGDRVQWEDYLIGLLLQNPGLNSHVCGIINDGDFTGTDTRELYHILNSVYQRGSSSTHQPLEELVPTVLLATIVRARKCVESGSPLDGAGLVRVAVQCATRLKRIRLVQLNTELQYLIREAEESGDATAVREFRHRLLAIHRQLRTIDSATQLQG